MQIYFTNIPLQANIVPSCTNIDKIIKPFLKCNAHKRLGLYNAL